MPLHDFVYRLEEGGGMRYFRLSLIPLALLVVTLLYDAGAFRNMSSQEAMDAAQLGRNLAQGKGYSTLFVRPFSMHLLQKHAEDKQDPSKLTLTADCSQLKGNHPDLANAPVYPVVLAGLMKALPFRYSVNTTHPFWSVPRARVSDEGGRQFWRYQPDFLISAFNQVLFFAVVVLLFLLVRRLFDNRTAWLSAVLILGTELFWRFTVSGLPTMLLLLLFTGLVWCLVWLEEEFREPKDGPGRLLLLAAAAGLLVGVGGLTRYAFGWLILPVVAFLLIFAGRRRWPTAALAFAAFAVVMTPWVVRNYSLSGTPFGTAGYAIIESTPAFPGNLLERSLAPDLNSAGLQALRIKLLANTRQILQNELPRVAGGWVTPFFLVGLLVAFPSPAVRRLRWFLLLCLPPLILAQALGRTHLSDDSPEINSENLLLLLAPLVLVYGVSLFYLLLDQIHFPARELYHGALGLFAVVACLPMLFTLFPIILGMVVHFQLPRGEPVAYPPYYPPAIQSFAGWLKEEELTMSDVPWAVAWYGQRQSVWLTLRAAPDPKDPASRENFYAINDYQKRIAALYLTPVTMNSRFLTEWEPRVPQGWGTFLLQILNPRGGPEWNIDLSLIPPSRNDKRDLIEKFPLRRSQPGWFPEQLILTDWERWRQVQ